MEVDSPSTRLPWLQQCSQNTKRKPEFESAGPGLRGTLLGLVRTRAPGTSGAEFGSTVVGGSWGEMFHQERKPGLQMERGRRNKIMVALGLEGGREREEA